MHAHKHSSSFSCFLFSRLVPNKVMEKVVCAFSSVHPEEVYIHVYIIHSQNWVKQSISIHASRLPIIILIFREVSHFCG